MPTALKDPMLLHSRTNEDVKKRLFSLTRKQRKETKRIKPLETSRLALIRSYANMMPTLGTNSDLICLNDTGKYVSEKKKRKENFLPARHGEDGVSSPAAGDCCVDLSIFTRNACCLLITLGRDRLPHHRGRGGSSSEGLAG